MTNRSPGWVLPGCLQLDPEEVELARRPGTRSGPGSGSTLTSTVFGSGILLQESADLEDGGVFLFEVGRGKPVLQQVPRVVGTLGLNQERVQLS